jgi:hypothetical protein
MKKIWKKLTVESRGTRVVFAFLYTYISLTISLDHTCNPAFHQTVEYHQECTNHSHGFGSHPEIQKAFAKNASAGIICTDSQYCAACLYSLLAKSSRLSRKVLLVAIEVSFIIQVLPQYNFIKQDEYLSSVSLRAPPSIIF